MEQPYSVASFWAGSSLSFFEQVCIQSFLDAGYDYYLYTFGDVGNVPQGVTILDARSIFDGRLENGEDVRKYAAVYSDVFRLHLMLKTDYLWVDTDVYCLKPTHWNKPYMFGFNRKSKKSNNCVLRLPKTSPSLLLMLDFMNASTPIPHWWRQARLEPFCEKIRAGHRPTLYNLPWATTGPGLLSWALQQTGEIHRGQTWVAYYQYNSALNYEFLNPDLDASSYEGDHVFFIHLFGSTKIHIRDEFGGLPPEGSYIDVICRRHNIDPLEAPIPHFKAAVQSA